MADVVAYWGPIAWLIALTFVCGMVYERLQHIVKRLDKGDENFKEIRDEQTTMSRILVELRAIREHESRRLALMERQTQEVLQTLAAWRGVAMRTRPAAPRAA